MHKGTWNAQLFEATNQVNVGNNFGHNLFKIYYRCNGLSPSNCNLG